MDIVYDLWIYSAMDKILLDLEFGEFGKTFREYFTAKWVSKNVQYQLENVSFSNTLTIALIMLVLQITTVKE